MTVLERFISRAVTGTMRLGIGLSRTEIRFVGVNHAGVPVWTHSVTRGRTDVPLSDQIGAAFAKRPPVMRGHVRVTCVVGPCEAQLRPLHGLPQLKSATQQLALVRGSLDRFFIGDCARMRIATPVRGSDGELWAAAVDSDVVAQFVSACRAHRLRLVGLLPVAAALGRLAAHAASVHTEEKPDAHVVRTDDGTRLHVVYHANGLPSRTWRERDDSGVATLSGPIVLHDRVVPTIADAYAATFIGVGDPFVISEHSDDMRRARFARQRIWLWSVTAAASLVAAAWVPGVLALRRAERARARLTALGARQRELQAVQSSLAASSATLGSVAAFERSRRSVTLLLGELALALPDSTALTTLNVDSLGGTINILAPRAVGTVEALSEIPLISRVQMTGSVNREVVSGTELERAALRFTLASARPLRPTARLAPTPRADTIAHGGHAVATTSPVHVLGVSPRRETE